MKKVLNFVVDNYIVFLIYALIGWIYEVSWFLIIKNEFVNRGVLFGPFLPVYGFGMLLILFILKKFVVKKHYADNLIYTVISIFTIVTFIYTTIIEYAVPKITNVNYYLENYGIGLVITNLLFIIISIIIVKKNDKIKKINTNIILVFLIIWIVATLVEFIAHYYIETYSHKLLWDYSKDFLNINRRINWDASRNFAIGGTLLFYIVQPLVEKILKLEFKNKVIITLIIGIPMLIDLITNVILK